MIFASMYLEVYQIKHLQPEMDMFRIRGLSKPNVVYHSFDAYNNLGQKIAGSSSEKDTKIAEMFIITQEKIYLIKDGYEPKQILQKRKKKYLKKVARWQEQRETLRKLFDIERKKRKFIQYSHKGHPEYIYLNNLLKTVLRDHYSDFRSLVTRSTIEKEHLRKVQKRYGVYTPEYKRQKEIAQRWEAKRNERERELMDLVENNISKEFASAPFSDPPPAISQEGKGAEESTSSEPSFSWLPRPPPMEDAGLYKNALDSDPDFVAVSLPGEPDPHFLKEDLGEEQWVKENFGNFYKELRNRHVHLYVQIYKKLVLDALNSDAKLKIGSAEKDPLCKLEKKADVFPQNEDEPSPNTNLKPQRIKDQNIDSKKIEGTPSSASVESEQPVTRRVDISSREGDRYTALDCDQDGITETFLVHSPTGFHWYQRGMPNVVSIFNNKDPEIQEMIQGLVKLVSQGSEEIREQIQKDLERNLRHANGIIQRFKEVNRVRLSPRSGSSRKSRLQ